MGKFFREHSSLPFRAGIGTRPERVAEASSGPFPRPLLMRLNFSKNRLFIIQKKFNPSTPKSTDSSPLFVNKPESSIQSFLHSIQDDV